ncbi:unnamed protein product [marine sediment metagenome]|uniref:Uncharacterized protein n=1 Tax=marine sediment metagenome TaxID=412755 RepID=X1B8D1_9ZZZZ
MESNIIYLYPFPGSITWNVTDGEGDLDTAEYGSDDIDVDTNLVIVFDKEPAEATADDSESDFAPFLHKYIDAGVLARAYGANTDGRIRSLADYWEMRQVVAKKAIMRFLSKRRTDRTYTLKSSNGASIRSNRHPRLPDAYPVTYP